MSCTPRRAPSVFLAASCAALGLIPSGTLAATFVVTPAGPITIQAAIDAAAPGDSVVLAGTSATPFTGDGNRDISLRGKAITVTGAGSDPWIDCEGTHSAPHRGFLFTNGEGPGTVLEFATITGGDTEFFGAGGAIRCADSSPTISHCHLTGNYASVGGAAISSAGGSPHIADCLAANNRQYTSPGDGGAIAVGGGAPLVENCTVRDNTSGGVAIWGQAVVRNCVIEANYYYALRMQSGTIAEDCVIRHGGDAVQMYGAALLRRCRIDENDLGGYGVWVNGTGGRLENDTISGNPGGGIWLNGTRDVVISGCLISGNGGSTYGTASGLWVTDDAYGRLEGSTITGNRNEAGPGGIDVLRGARLTVVESIVQGNCGSVAYEIRNEIGGTLSFECSAFNPPAVSGPWTDLGHNVSADPLFCAPELCTASPTLAGDYTLHENSPCATAHSPCGRLIGALDVACGVTAVEATTWGALKQHYR